MYIKVVASGILFSKLLTLVLSLLYTVLFTTLLLAISLNFFNSAGTVFNLSVFAKSFTFVFKLF